MDYRPLDMDTMGDYTFVVVLGPYRYALATVVEKTTFVWSRFPLTYFVGHAFPFRNVEYGSFVSI